MRKDVRQETLMDEEEERENRDYRLWSDVQGLPLSCGKVRASHTVS